MIRIETGNSYSQVVGITTTQFAELRKLLSYVKDPQAAYYSAFGPKTVYLIDKKGFFPSGLLQKVYRHLRSVGLEVLVNDTSVIPKPSLSLPAPNFGFTPYPEQVHAVLQAYSEHCGTIQMATGFGKSVTIALLVAKLDLRTLIVVPNLELKRQLTDSFTSWFGSLRGITIENIDSAALKKNGDYDMLIIDEAHHAAASTYQKLNKTVWKGIYHRFFFTATPYRTQEQEQLVLEGIAHGVIYSLPYKKAVELGVIVPVEAYYLDVPEQSTDAHTWAQVYSQLVVNNDPRNLMIANLLTALKDASTLCLVKEIRHGELLQALTGIPFANGQDEASRQHLEEFSQGRIKQVIATTGVAGEGLDTKPCEYVVVAGLGKAKGAFMQQIGRGVRKYEGKESAKVILLKDKSHRFTLRHYNAQAKILRDEYGVKPAKVQQ